MITAQFYKFQQGSGEQVEPQAISEYVQRRDGMLWVDIVDPTDADLDLIKSEFKLHSLAIEDVQQKEQRPKIIEYDDYIFFVLYELLPEPDGKNANQSCVRRGSELHQFVSANFFIGIHDGKSQAVESLHRRWDRMQEQHKLGPYYLLYLLLDSVTDNYFPALDAFDERVEKLEDRIAVPYAEMVKDHSPADRQDDLSELIRLRHNLIMMRRVVTPLRDAVNVLLRHVENVQDEGEDAGDKVKAERAERARYLFAYFQDIYDHSIRLVDSIDTYRDILSGLVDANLAVTSNRTNEIMKVLTSVSIILMSIGVITGLYGMNFINMPELHWKFGYFYALALIVVISLLELRYFKNRHWL